jgi:hypothetical protein
MDAFFFRVEHDLLRSESFKALGGSAIKVYLVIGLYSDFGTGWPQTADPCRERATALCGQGGIMRFDAYRDFGRRIKLFQ